jgi:hypothetical protein
MQTPSKKDRLSSKKLKISASETVKPSGWRLTKAGL